MPARVEIAPETAAAARALYERTLTPIGEICKLMKVSRSVFYARAQEWGWQRRRYSTGAVAAGAAAPPPAGVEASPPCEAAQPADEPFTEERRAALHARALRTAELRVAKIERILLMLDPKNAAEAERAARIVSTTDRPLREIISLTAPNGAASTDDSETDQVPRDLVTLREELARRINAFIDARRADGGAGDRDGNQRLDTGGD